MPIGLHIILGFALQIGVFLFVVFNLNESMLFIIIVVFPAILLVRFAYRHFIPARCEVDVCGGSAFQKGSRPLYYECSTCGHVHKTKWYEGSGTVGG
jgi:hypothetical protein